MTLRFEIRFDPYARRALDTIDKAPRRRILERIAALATIHGPPGWSCSAAGTVTCGSEWAAIA